MNRQNVEIVDEFDYSEVSLESTGYLNRRKRQLKEKSIRLL